MSISYIDFHWKGALPLVWLRRCIAYTGLSTRGWRGSAIVILTEVQYLHQLLVDNSVLFEWRDLLRTDWWLAIDSCSGFCFAEGADAGAGRSSSDSRRPVSLEHRKSHRLVCSGEIPPRIWTRRGFLRHEDGTPAFGRLQRLPLVWRVRGSGPTQRTLPEVSSDSWGAPLHFTGRPRSIWRASIPRLPGVCSVFAQVRTTLVGPTE